MKDKKVGCLSCKKAHMMSERVRPDHYSGFGWITACPSCGNEGYVSARALQRHMREVRV